LKARVRPRRFAAIARRHRIVFPSGSSEARMTLAEGTLLAFTAFSGLRLVSYLPQIHKIVRDANGASAISYSTWVLWTGCHVSTGLYAGINLGDRVLATTSALYVVCCLAVIAITAIKRYRFGRCRENPAGRVPARKPPLRDHASAP
jgi:hypothetical protein